MKPHRLTTRLFLRTQKTRKDGKAPIYLRLYLNGKKKEIHTNEFCEPEQWDDPQRSIKMRAVNPMTGRNEGVIHARQKNSRIKALESSIYEIEEQLLANRKAVTIDRIVEMLKKGRDVDFIEFCEQVLQGNKPKKGRTGKRYGYNSLRSNRSKLAQLKEYRAKLPMHELDTDFFMDFAQWLEAKGNGRNSINTKFRFFKAMCADALEAGYLQANPFSEISLTDVEPRPKEILNSSEVSRLYQIWKKGDLFAYQHNALTYFLCGCYTGADYATYREFSMVNVQDGVFTYTRDKTKNSSGKAPRVPLPKRGLELFSHIDRMNLKPYSLQKINTYIKEVAQLAGIEKSLSTHCARHSFAVIHLNEQRARVEEVAAMMGHASTRTTLKHYARFLDYNKRELQSIFDR